MSKRVWRMPIAILHQKMQNHVSFGRHQNAPRTTPLLRPPLPHARISGGSNCIRIYPSLTSVVLEFILFNLSGPGIYPVAGIRSHQCPVWAPSEQESLSLSSLKSQSHKSGNWGPGFGTLSQLRRQKPQSCKRERQGWSWFLSPAKQRVYKL